MDKFTKGVILVMKRIFTAIGVTAAALALALTSTSSVAASPAAASPESLAESFTVPVTAVEQRTCRARFADDVNQRLNADAASRIIGTIPAETWVQVSCSRVADGDYDACGLSSHFWMEAYWNGNWGHSVWSCVKDWEYTS